MLLSFRALDAFLPPQRLGGPGSRLGARPEGRRVAVTPPSPGHLALGSRNWAQCPPVTRSDGAGRPREEQARPRPSLSRSGPARGEGRLPSAVKPGRRPRMPCVPGTISSRTRQDTGRGVPSSVQVRAGEAGGGPAVPHAFSRRLRPRPRGPRGRGLVRERPPPAPRGRPRCTPAPSALSCGGAEPGRRAGPLGPGARGSASPAGSPFM